MDTKRERGNRLLRFLDRYAGIPLVLALGAFKRKTGIISEIKNAAFLKTAAIGDTILLSAAVDSFKRKYPRASITFFVGSSNLEATDLIAGIDRTIKLPISNPLEAVRLIRRSGAYDVWLDFDSWPRINAFFSYMSRSRTTVGFRTSGQFRHYCYDVNQTHSDSIHEAENYMRLLAPLSVHGQPAISVDGIKKEKAPRRAVMHMFPGGSKSHLKEWPEENWKRVVSELTESGYEIFLTGGKSDRSRLENFISGTAGVRAAVGSLRETAELLSSSEIVISVNTGIMHLAAALGCNLVALHGPTSRSRWGPLNENSISLQSPVECSPCLNLGFEYKCGEGKCMEAIRVEDVTEAIDVLRIRQGGGRKEQ